MLKPRLLPVVLSLFLGACCNLPEEYAVSASAVHELTIAWPERTAVLRMGGRIAEGELAPARFRPMFDAIRGQAGTAAAVVITLTEQDPATNEAVSLTLALPAALRRGARYQVGGVFSSALVWRDLYQAWGTRPLQHADRAEVAFSASVYAFPPPVHTPTFVATEAEGTIDIVERGTGWFHAAVVLRLTDADGRVVNVTGTVQAQAERYSPSCS
jgi:hypothetical protein